ncbi:MAG: alpha-E domain-containing protein [Pirellulales bacterium]
MLSRVADSVFWMARYVERSENVARFVDVNQNLTLDLGEQLADQWAPLVATTGDWESFRERYGPATRDNVLQFLTCDGQNPNSILSCVRLARENARTAREIISSDMWEELNRFYLFVRDAATVGKIDDYFEFCSQVKRSSALLIGTTDVTMSHGEAWNFARMGRLLERADKTSRILDVKYFILLPTAQDVGSSLDVVQWSALLKSASALAMYRQARGRIVPKRVAEFLMLDRIFPRSIRYCVGCAEDSLHAITGTPPGSFGNRAEQELGRLRSELDFTSIDDVVQFGLHEFIDTLQLRLTRIDAAIQESFCAADPVEPFRPTQMQAQMS